MNRIALAVFVGGLLTAPALANARDLRVGDTVRVGAMYCATADQWLDFYRVTAANGLYKNFGHGGCEYLSDAGAKVTAIEERKSFAGEPSLKGRQPNFCKIALLGDGEMKWSDPAGYRDGTSKGHWVKQAPAKTEGWFSCAFY